jgi:hypothetical protein
MIEEWLLAAIFIIFIVVVIVIIIGYTKKRYFAKNCYKLPFGIDRVGFVSECRTGNFESIILVTVRIVWHAIFVDSTSMRF